MLLRNNSPIFSFSSLTNSSLRSKSFERKEIFVTSFLEFVESYVKNAISVIHTREFTQCKRMNEPRTSHKHYVKKLRACESHFNLKDDTLISSRPRTLPHAYQNSIYKQIDKLLDEGIIEISDSPYASPIALVLKKDGTIRLFCDFRALNEKTIPKTFPIPKSEDLLDLKGSEVFTV